VEVSETGSLIGSFKFGHPKRQSIWEEFFSRREEEKFFFDPLAGFFIEYRLRGCYQYDSKYFFGTPSSAQGDCKKSYLISMNIR
jgi:hypothetical protein